MRARAYPLILELSTNKKENISIYEYLLRVRAITDSFMTIGDPISKHDQVDAIL